jgi:YARHG domain
MPRPSLAACYEEMGCTDSDLFRTGTLRKANCSVLWEMRNGIFKENGYCFHTARAVSVFGNAGCAHDDAAQVPPNAVERQNIAASGSVEASKGCD